MKLTIKQILSGEPVHTNDLQKGDWVRQFNGWKAEVWDNMRGNTRVCNVHGVFTEAGSVYSHDIEFFTVDSNHEWFDALLDNRFQILLGVPSLALIPVTHTKAQLDLKKKVAAFW